MIGSYPTIALVIGIVLSYLAIIHHFWLRDVFKEEALEENHWLWRAVILSLALLVGVIYAPFPQ